MKKYVLIIHDTETLVYYFNTLEECHTYTKRHKITAYTIALIYEDSENG